MINIDELKNLYEIISKETIMALEIEDDYGRHWESGKRDIINERLNNLCEGEYFSDLDVCAKQEHPVCKEFFNKMYNVDEYNKHCIFNEREFFPMYLIGNGETTIEEIRERDLPLLEEILKSKPNEFLFEEDLKGYRFKARLQLFPTVEEYNFFIYVPLLLELSKEIDEKIECRINYYITAENRGSIPFNVPFSELVTCMNKLISDKEYRMKLIRN